MSVIKITLAVVAFVYLVRVGDSAVADLSRISEQSDDKDIGALANELRDDVVTEIKDYINSTFGKRLDVIEEWVKEALSKQRYQNFCVSNGNPCEHEGRCVIDEGIQSNTFHCECPDEWMGDRCQDRPHEWSCADDQLYADWDKMAYIDQFVETNADVYYPDLNQYADQYADSYKENMQSERRQMENICGEAGGAFASTESDGFHGCGERCHCCMTVDRPDVYQASYTDITSYTDVQYYDLE